MPIRIINLSLALSLLLVTAAGARRQEGPAPGVLPVTVCDLSRDPALYNQRVIRLTAIYAKSYHGDFLYDPDCGSSGDYMDVELEDSGAEGTSPQAREALEKAMAGGPHPGGAKSRARVVVVGRFKDWDGVGYGHLSAARFQFSVLRFEEAEPVPSDVPWGVSVGGAENFMGAVERLRLMAADWNGAYVGGNIPAIEKVLPEDFILADERGSVMTRQLLIARAAGGRKVMSGKRPPHVRVTVDGVFLDGDSATVTGSAAAGRCKKSLRRYRYTDQYVKREGRWVIVSARLAADAGPQEAENFPCDK